MQQAQASRGLAKQLTVTAVQQLLGLSHGAQRVLHSPFSRLCSGLATGMIPEVSRESLRSDGYQTD